MSWTPIVTQIQGEKLKPLVEIDGSEALVYDSSMTKTGGLFSHEFGLVRNAFLRTTQVNVWPRQIAFKFPPVVISGQRLP
jgi:hypothetical protein